MELKDSAADLTMHGLGKIASSTSKPMKLLWINLMTFSLGTLIFFIQKMTVEYLAHGTLSNQQTIIRAKIPFPAITVCGPTVSKEKIQQFFKESNKTFPSDMGSPNLGLGRYFNSENILHQLENRENFQKVIPDEDSFLLKKLDGSCQQGFIRKCNFSTDVERILQIYKGYCYKFNPKGSFIQARHGRDEAISIILFLNVSDFLPWPQYDSGESVDVFVNDYKEFPFVYTGPVLAPVGHITQIEIRKSELKRKKAPYSSDCTNGENIKLYFDGVYSVINCQHSCFLSKISQQCRTHDFYTNIILPKDKRKPFFSFPPTDLCVQKVYEKLLEENYASCNCKLPCNEVKYEKTVSYSKWPSEADIPIYKQLFSKALDLNASEVADDFVRRNFLRIDVYYGDMMYRMISEEESYSFGKLIGDIGGYMGLLVGASVFSLLELIVFLLQTVRFATKRNKINDVKTIAINVDGRS